MRLIVLVVTLGLLGVLGLAGRDLWTTMHAPSPPLAEAVAPVQTAAGTVSGTTDKLTGVWPALFGTRAVPEPEPPRPSEPEAEPQPPSPPAPPLASLGYTLKGVVSDGSSRWAMVSHPTGDQLLRAGDTLGDTYTVTRIDEQGLWAQGAPGDAPQLLAFAE